MEKERTGADVMSMGHGWFDRYGGLGKGAYRVGGYYRTRDEAGSVRDTLLGAREREEKDPKSELKVMEFVVERRGVWDA